MPVGTGAVLLQNVPVQGFRTDPALFNQLTTRNVNSQLSGIPIAGAGTQWVRQLPQTGIIAKLRITFTGTITVATAAATTSDQWPYNFLKSFVLSANGQNQLFVCDGLDLSALRDARYPAFQFHNTDTFPGTIGAGSSIGVGTSNFTLNWEVPLAMDDVSLIGSLFAQSSATNITIAAFQCMNSDLFTANPGNVTFAGAWNVEDLFFEVPYDAQGDLIVPDLSRLHGVNVFDTTFTATGPNRIPLIRSQGQLSRLFVSVRSGLTARLSALPSSALSARIDAIQLGYGGNQAPYIFNPAWNLLELNAQWFGGPLVYDRLCFDFVKENPPRDVWLMQGVTELACTPTIDTGVTVTAGSVHLVQETLF